MGNETKDAFIGYAENNETIANEFEIAEEEIKKVKKMFNLEAANADLKKRQDILKKSTDTINGLFSSINANMATMSITIPEDKKKILTKYVTELQANTKIECDKYSNDVKFWAEYRTGIKEFSPWLA